MKIQTRTPRVERARRTILEMLTATVDLSDAPDVRQMIKEYAADEERFPDAETRRYPMLDDNPMYIRDYSKCILCWRCVQVCAEDAQYTYAINFSGRGFDTRIDTFFDLPMPSTTCVVCGQCVGVCPTGALKPKREWLLEQGAADGMKSLRRRPMTANGENAPLFHPDHDRRQLRSNSGGGYASTLENNIHHLPLLRGGMRAAASHRRERLYL